MTPQSKRLLDHLEANGQINPLVALNQLGIYRLADTVYKIKNLGYDIITKQTTSLNRFKEKVCFCKI